MLGNVLRVALEPPAPDLEPEAPPPLPPPPPPRAPAVPGEADAACAQQWLYICSTALFNAVCCSRRAGKTNGAVPRAIRVLAREGTWVHYVSLIRRNARKQFWRPLLRKLEQLGWERDHDYFVNETEMMISTAWGSHLQALSCNDVAGVSAIVGDRSDLFIIDECQEPNDDVITALVDRAATVMLVDTGGMLDMLGTPPEAEPCYFSEALDNDGWAHFHWTMFDHDFPRSREKKWETVKDICRRRGLRLDVREAHNDNGRLELEVGPDTHPLIAREYFGLRRKDPSKIAYEYQAVRNDYDPRLENFSMGDWRFAGGLDLGFQDRDAVVIGCWNEKDSARRLLVRWKWQLNHLDVDDLADVLAVVEKVFGSIHWCGDHGGHAAQSILLTLSRRLRVPIRTKPADVMASVGLVNDDYRTARLLLPIVDDVTQRLVEKVERMGWDERRKDNVRKLILLEKPADLASESGKVAKTINPRTKKVEINKKGFHSDLTEALRYMHHMARHFWSEGEPVLPSDPQQRRELEIREQVARWEAARKRSRWG